MSDLFGVRVIEDRFLPPDTMVAMGDFAYAIVHGAVLIRGATPTPEPTDA